MKRSEFKNFKEAVENANQYSPVWWAGYLWLNLTDSQADEIRKLLIVHPSIVRTEEGLMFPSGMCMRA